MQQEQIQRTFVVGPKQLAQGARGGLALRSLLYGGSPYRRAGSAPLGRLQESPHGGLLLGSGLTTHVVDDDRDNRQSASVEPAADCRPGGNYRSTFVPLLIRLS